MALKIIIFSVVIFLIYGGYVLQQAQSKYENGAKAINAISYNLMKNNTQIILNKWVEEYKIKKGWRLKKIEMSESGFGRGFKAIGLPEPRVKELVELHMWKMPPFDYINNERNKKNAYKAILKSVGCVRGDLIETGIDTDGNMVARVLLDQETTAIWFDKDGKTYEYIPFFIDSEKKIKNGWEIIVN